MRPGVGAGLPPYPPSLGRPPLTRLQRHTLALDGHPYALPPGWRVQPGHAHGLQLLSGDGVGQPIRQARLQVLPPSDLDSLWSQQLQSKEDQGWTIVAWQRGGLSQWARLERPHQLGLSRGALVIQAEPGRLLLLDYEFEDGYDLFTVTRDLDYLRSSLGFDW